MQYNISINQYAVITSGLDLDVTDMAIFNFICLFAHSDRCAKLQTQRGVYFWISHKAIIEQLPILGITTGAGIIKRINRLIDAGLLERHPDCDMMRKTFYRFGRNYEKVFLTPNEGLQPLTNVEGTLNNGLGTPLNSCLGNNNTSIDNNTRDNNIAADGGLFPVDSPVKKKHLFADSPYFDFSKFASRFEVEIEKGVDVEYYYNAVADWSASNGQKKVDWIATARTWMRKDMTEGKLRMQKGRGCALSEDAMKYLREMSE